MKVGCLVPRRAQILRPADRGPFAVIDLRKAKVLRWSTSGVVPVHASELHPPRRPVGSVRALLKPTPRPARRRQLHDRRQAGSLGQVAVPAARRRAVGAVIELAAGTTRASGARCSIPAHLSEVFVPYMDPDEGWYWRTYMDSGEYGFGNLSSPLRAGVDCPDYATFLPAPCRRTTANRSRSPMPSACSSAALGDPAWRHFEIFNGPPRAGLGSSWWSAGLPDRQLRLSNGLCVQRPA